MAAFRTLWAALVSLYEETLVLVGANFVALALNVPLGLVLFLIGLPFVSSTESPGSPWLVAIIAWLMPFLPTPGNLALAGLTRVAAGPDVPRFFQFRESFFKQWRLALRASAVSLVVQGALVWNVTFYLGLGSGWLQFVAILWLYAVVFWLCTHIYLVPLAVHIGEPRLFDLYRRAVFIALGHPLYTLLLLVVLLIVAFASVVFLPVYLLVAPAFISLTQAHALREIRRRHGDLAIETEEEVSRL
jgi:uncharacterized membrane protein YesL